MENKTPEEILIKIWDAAYPEDIQLEITLNPSVELITSAMQEYGKQQYNQAVLDCIENAKTIKTGNSGSWHDASVDKESMKKLLKQ